MGLSPSASIGFLSALSIDSLKSKVGISQGTRREISLSLNIQNERRTGTVTEIILHGFVLIFGQIRKRFCEKCV